MPRQQPIPQSAVIPILKKDDELHVVLITSMRTGGWGIPKGIIEPDLSPQESAAEEAWEEAGLEGAVSEASVGSYRYEKWGGICEVAVYLMSVETVHTDYPEQLDRDRQIVPLKEAWEFIKNRDQAQLLQEVARDPELENALAAIKT